MPPILFGVELRFCSVSFIITSGFAPQFRTKVARELKDWIGDYGLVYGYFIFIEC